MENKFELIVEPNSIEKNYWKDIWRYRGLFYFLSWKEYLIRYKQTVVGILWSVIRPLLTMVVFTFIFGKIAKLPSQGVPYAILVYAGLLPWQFFSTSFSESSNSLIANSNLISKIYFPRIIIPASSIIVNLVDFFISFLILVLVMFYYGFVPSINILFLPLLVFFTFLTSYGAGILIAALNVKYRDFKYIVPFIVQFGVYISPVGFSNELIPLKYKYLYAINPMVGIIEAFRWAIIGKNYVLDLNTLLISLVVTVILLSIAIKYFRNTEKKFADII